MKRINTALLMIFMLMIPMTINASTYITEGNICVQGKLPEVRPGTVVTLLVTTDAKNWFDNEKWESTEIDNVEYCSESIVDKNGEYKFNYFLNSNGRYRQYLKASGYKYVVESEFTFLNATEYATALEEVFVPIIADNANSVSELATILGNNETELGLFDEIFSSYDDYAVSAKYVFDALKGKSISEFEDDEVSKIIKKAVFLDLVNNDVENIEKYINWIYDGEKYSDEFADKIIDYLKNDNSLDSITSLETASDKAMMLVCANNLKDSGALQPVLCKYSNLINVKAENITVTICGEVINNVPFSDVDSLGVFVASRIQSNHLNPEPPSNGGGTNGGGGSGSGGISHSYTGTTGIIEKTDNTIEHISYFTDLDTVEWARESIEGLFNKGIINGKGQRLYCPNDMITREEFVKILMSMYNTELVDDVTLPFEDVSTDVWYYKYVKSAYLAGVTNGVTENKFGVGINVSRQDLCVMIVRFMNSIGKTFTGIQTVNFSDEDMISDYARDAVSTLSSSGVVSGDGNGKFNPLKNATRAEAAKIVYYTMKLFK